MFKRFPRLVAAVATTTAILAGAGCALADPPAFDPAKPVFTPADQVPWHDVNPAIRFGDAFGDRATGPQGTFGTFPPNFITPVHVHTNAYHGIVLFGTMTNPMGLKGDPNAAKMGPGSYWYVPAGMPHATACISNTPCMFYMHANKAFDFTVVEKEKKDTK